MVDGAPDEEEAGGEWGLRNGVVGMEVQVVEDRKELQVEEEAEEQSQMAEP